MARPFRGDARLFRAAYVRGMANPDLTRPPVLLLGGINLVRALGLAGIPAIVASPDPDDPAFSSCYCNGRVVLPPLSEREAVVQALLDTSARLFQSYGRQVPLMFGNDDYLELIHAHRDRLQGRFLMILNDQDVAQSLMEKSRFADLAASRGVPVPLTLRWEVEGADGLGRFPGKVLVKPKLKMDWHDSPLHDLLFTDDGKALVFENGAAAMAHPLVERHRNQLTFQEFIPGDDRHLWSFHGFADENGELIAAFVGRKIRTYPPITGESAFIEMVRDPGLAAFGKLIAGRIPLRGFFKIDFKQDPRDGRLFALEVNARCTLWHYLGAVNGVNLVGAAYEYLVHGRRMPSASYSTERRWVYMRLDFLAFRALARRGELGLVSWLRSLAAAPRIYNVFAWNDPGPFVALWEGRLARRARRAGEKLRTWMRQWLSTAS
jgi:D-aspartate ligase